MQVPPRGSERGPVIADGDDSGAHRPRKAREYLRRVGAGKWTVLQGARESCHLNHEPTIFSLGTKDSMHGLTLSQRTR